MVVTTEPTDPATRDDELPTLVVLGGPPPPLAPLRTAAARVIAVDSGIDHALAAGRTVDVAVGDFDSVSDVGLDRLGRSGARIDRHDAAKDATDLELALEVAVEDRPGSIVVVGSHPDQRIDHWLGTVLCLASPRWRPSRIEAHLGAARLVPVHDRATLDVESDAVISLFALHGDAELRSTSGLAWPLRDDVLLAGSSRGVSNVATAERVEVAVDSGVVLVVVPGPGGA